MTVAPWHLSAASAGPAPTASTGRWADPLVPERPTGAVRADPVRDDAPLPGALARPDGLKDTYEQQRSEAAGIATFLRLLADRWADLDQAGWAASARARAERYDAVASSAADRAHVYAARTRRQAVTRWLHAHRTRESWGSANNRSPWSPVKDLVAAVAKVPGLRR
jgi:hypothetical protein